MDGRTFAVTDPVEILVVEQALAMSRQLRQVCRDAPYSKVLARAETAAVEGGRELTRAMLQAELDRAAAERKKKLSRPNLLLRPPTQEPRTRPRKLLTAAETARSDCSRTVRSHECGRQHANREIAIVRLHRVDETVSMSLENPCGPTADDLKLQSFPSCEFVDRTANRIGRIVVSDERRHRKEATTHFEFGGDRLKRVVGIDVNEIRYQSVTGGQCNAFPRIHPERHDSFAMGPACRQETLEESRQHLPHFRICCLLGAAVPVIHGDDH